MDLEEAIRTTASAHRFTDQSPPNHLIYQALDLARFAPSGGNRQGWHVVVVRDQETRKRIGDLYLAEWERYVAKWYGGKLSPTRERKLAAGTGFARSISKIPVHLAVWVDQATLEVTDRDLDRPSVVAGGSIFPFVQNLNLACRSLGLGTRVTTLLSRNEQVIRDLLEAPATYALAAVVMLGLPEHQVTTLSRRPVQDFATIDRYDGPPLTETPS